MKKIGLALSVMLLLGSLLAQGYTPPFGAFAPVPLAEGAQAMCEGFTPGSEIRIAYMPPGTEFPYYMDIGKGIEAQAAEAGVTTFMLAPQSGSDIAGQMGMIQDALIQGVDAIILSTHDEGAATPLVQSAVEQGIVIIIVNSDIADFPTAVHGVVGYHQRGGTFDQGLYLIDLVDGTAKVGVLEGLPGYHSTERIGGFLDAFADQPGMEIVTSLPTAWNVETGNQAMMDLLQARPEVTMVVTANDYIALGAAAAAAALGRSDVIIAGNDGDPAGLEAIAEGRITSTVNTQPVEMGKVALQVTLDCLAGEFPGGWVETPTVVVDQSNIGAFWP